MFRGEITEFQLYQNRKAEKLIMMPFCQEDLAMHGHNFFELAYITGGTAEHSVYGFFNDVQNWDVVE